MDFQHRLTLWEKEIKTDTTGGEYEVFENCTPISPANILSSAHGKINEVLLIFPDDEAIVDNYLIFFNSYIQTLTNTRIFLIVRGINPHDINPCSKIGAAIDEIYHRYEPQRQQGQLFIVPNKQYNFFMWPQDPFIVAKKNSNHQRVLFIPTLKNHNGIDNNNLADFFAKWYNRKFPKKAFATSRIERHFQGGNLIAAHPLVFIGNASIRRSHNCAEKEMHRYYNTKKDHICLTPIIKHVLSDFKRNINPKKHFIPVGNKMKFISEETRNGNTHKIVEGVLKCFQPLYHLDLFLNLVEQSASQRHLKMMLGIPIDITGISQTDLAAAELLKNLTENIQAIIPTLQNSTTLFGDFTVEILPVPLPMVYKRMGHKYEWYPLSFNNCLVEITSSQKKVWLPNYQVHSRNFGWSNFRLQRVETNLNISTQQIRNQWERLGFQVHLIDTSIQFAESLSGLHCLVKCLDRTYI